MIKLIETLSMNAWASMQTMIYDGWILRFADGYTNRANSINPIYNSTIDINEKIKYCENIYESRKLKVVYKITKDISPSNLDSILEKRGYKIDRGTSVQVVNLNNIEENEIKAYVTNNIEEDWLNNYCELNQVSNDNKITLKKILNNIIPDKIFVSLKDNDKTISCGIGIVEGEYIGLYGLVVDSNYRKKGLGKQLILNLLKYGKDIGANKSYLQVMENNTPAINLYSKLGYKEIYKYWYRTKE